jgi:hypothetical protein
MFVCLCAYDAKGCQYHSLLDSRMFSNNEQALCISKDPRYTKMQGCKKSLEITLASLPSSQEVHSTSSQTLSRQIATGFAVSNKPTTIRRKIWPMSCAHPCHAFQLQNELCNIGFMKFPLCLSFSFTFLILYMIKIRFHEGERRQE